MKALKWACFATSMIGLIDVMLIASRLSKAPAILFGLGVLLGALIMTFAAMAIILHMKEVRQ